MTPQALGFDDFIEEVEDVLKEHKQQQKVRHSFYLKGHNVDENL